MLSDHNKRLITSTVITLKSFHSINMKYSGRHFMWSWILIDQALINFYFSTKSLIVNIRFMLSLYLSPKVITLSGFHCSKCFIFLLIKKLCSFTCQRFDTWQQKNNKCKKCSIKWDKKCQDIFFRNRSINQLFSFLYQH